MREMREIEDLVLKAACRAIARSGKIGLMQSNVVFHCFKARFGRELNQASCFFVVLKFDRRHPRSGGCFFLVSLSLLQVGSGGVARQNLALNRLIHCFFFCDLCNLTPT